MQEQNGIFKMLDRSQLNCNLTRKDQPHCFGKVILRSLIM